MTKRSLMKVIFWIAALYTLPLTYALWLVKSFGVGASGKLDVLVKLVGLLTPIPASWLVFSFQKRSSYLQQLRSVWSKAIEALQAAIQYTHLAAPTQEEFANVQFKLSCVIEEVRGVFKNLPESNSGWSRLRVTFGWSPPRRDKKSSAGLFPFEAFKQIGKCINSLGFAQPLDAQRSALVRNEINLHWKRLRAKFLSEFDRSFPTDPDSPFL